MTILPPQVNPGRPCGGGGGLRSSALGREGSVEASLPHYV